MSKFNGKYVVVIAQPVISNGRPSGLICATITLDSIQNELMRDTITATGRFIIITKAGKVFHHPDQKMIGRTVGKEIKDDGKTIIGLEKIVTEKTE